MYRYRYTSRREGTRPSPPEAQRQAFLEAATPIGVFDSGIGGLSVLREIRRELPGENLIYVADSAHAPYGDKPQEFIETRAFAITRFLLGSSAKAIVVACNTATGAAVSACDAILLCRSLQWSQL